MELRLKDVEMVPGTYQTDLSAMKSESGFSEEHLAPMKLGGGKVFTDIDQREAIILKPIFPRELPGGESPKKGGLPEIRC